MSDKEEAVDRPFDLGVFQDPPQPLPMQVDHLSKIAEEENVVDDSDQKQVLKEDSSHDLKVQIEDASHASTDIIEGPEAHVSISTEIKGSLVVEVISEEVVQVSDAHAMGKRELVIVINEDDIPSEPSQFKRRAMVMLVFRG